MTEVFLRRFRAQDAPQLADYFAQSEITDWLANVPENYRLQDAKEFIAARATADAHEHMTFAICEKDAPDVLLGGIGSRAAPEEALTALRLDSLVTIGYWTAPAHWGKGYASEAVDKIIVQMKDALNVSQIGALALVDNAPSIRVLEKAGFKRAVQAPMPHKGGRADTYIYLRDC
jgi:RimJ/RimL family protein N-acetyltransferase